MRASMGLSCLNFSFKFGITLGTFLLKNELLLGSPGLILFLFSFFLILAEFGMISFNDIIEMEPLFDLRCHFWSCCVHVDSNIFPFFFSALNTTIELRYGNTLYLIHGADTSCFTRHIALKIYNSWSDCCTIRPFYHSTNIYSRIIP